MSAKPQEHEWLALCQIERDHRAWLAERLPERGSAGFRNGIGGGRLRGYSTFK
jgi:hypothetical protein